MASAWGAPQARGRRKYSRLRSHKHWHGCASRCRPVQQKVWVEPMTLKAFARERITNGDELPMDKFGVFVGSKTKLTKK